MKKLNILNSLKVNKEYLIIGILLLIARIPFFFTRHIQEDAFISWRCAKNIIDFGVYGFNIDERVSASTSHLYVLISAVVYFFSSNTFTYLIPIINSILLIGSIFIISNTIYQTKNQILIFWILISMMPISLLISYSGMETSLIILAISILLKYLVHSSNKISALLVLFFIPFIRPDAIAITLIFFTALFFVENKVDFKFILISFLGVLVFLAFNKLYFNSYLNQTIIAKSINLDEKSLIVIFEDILKVIKILLLPVGTKYFENYSYIFIGVYIILFLIYIYFEVYKKERNRIALFLFLIGFVFPMAYGIGGALFPWYFWPSQLIVHFIAIISLMHLFSFKFKLRNIASAFSILIIILVVIAQFLLALNTGTHEHKYRADIGKYINNISSESESIMLEPIGYIPFYAERYTHDEIGLASTKISDYRKLYGARWWIIYTMEHTPDYLVEREHMIYYKTLDNYQLNEDEIKWFNKNYELIKHFIYEPENYTGNMYILSILRLGGHSDYYLYKRKTSEWTKEKK